MYTIAIMILIFSILAEYAKIGVGTVVFVLIVSMILSGDKQ